MVNKLNKPAIKDYSQKVAHKVCMDIFHDNKQYVGGQDILNLTNIEQVNLFILKNLFLKWKQEIDNLKSPYFDHEHEEVKDALNHYVNTLSQHICIDQRHLQHLVSNAVSETLTLTLSPYHYFKRYYYFRENEKISMQELKELLKYVKINRIIFETFIKKLESYKIENFLIEDIIEYYQQSFYEAADQVDDYEEIMQQFSQILPVELDKLVYDIDKSGKNVVTPYTAVEKHRIDELYGEDYKKNAKKAENEDVSSVNAFMDKISNKSSGYEQESKNDTKKTDTATSTNNTDEDVQQMAKPNNGAQKETNVKHTETVQQETTNTEIQEENQSNLQSNTNTDNEVNENNDQGGNNHEETNQQLHDEEKFNLSEEKNINIKLSINQKILFEKELFNGDTELMNRTIEKLERAPNMQEAQKIMKSMAWDDNNEASQEFYEMLEAKY